MTVTGLTRIVRNVPCYVPVLPRPLHLPFHRSQMWLVESNLLALLSLVTLNPFYTRKFLLKVAVTFEISMLEAKKRLHYSVLNWVAVNTVIYCHSLTSRNCKNYRLLSSTYHSLLCTRKYWHHHPHHYHHIFSVALKVKAIAITTVQVNSGLLGL